MAVEASMLDQAVKHTIDALEKGKDQIYGIAEAARNEYQLVVREAEDLKRQTLEQITLVERLSRAEQQARRTYAEAETSFRSEAERKALHDKAFEAQVAHRLAREQEQNLRQKRDALERRLKYLADMVERAERLVSQVGVALGYLVNNLNEVGNQLESAREARALGFSVIRAQEEERRRVAREIHDGPAQLLANVVLRIDVCEKLHVTGELARLREELAGLKELVRLSLVDVRKIIFDLRPMALDDLGLVPALRAYCKDFQTRTGVQVEFNLFGQEKRFPSAFEVAIFRLVQEGLGNVAKHAKASRASVKLELVAGRGLRLVIRDDGVGFDPSAVTAGEGGARFGLVGMRERTQLLGGELEITSSPSSGSRLDFSFPLPD